ncbi:hypothetical protein BKA70DRAFT_1117360 [Coprinopsis sp. MPI-PUGE-AT-0042]|nr:hypothetical protein BKA70DRAFT_1117360 [Coprinopsis sp. MPI-PUGE-AT-0042]
MRNLLHAKDTSGCIELLRRFDCLLVAFGFESPSMFRDAMKRYNVIVSGSTALSIILPFDQPLPVDDMDAYIASVEFKPFVEWLLKNTDFVQEIHWRDFDDLNLLYDTITCANTLESVTTFRSPSTKRRFQVISTLSDSPLTAVGAFHSTPVMNAILHCGVISFYPELTTQMKGIHNSTGSMLGKVGERPKCVQKVFDKYSARGFELGPDYYTFWDFPRGGIDIPGFEGHQCGDWAYCPQTACHSLDEGVLQLPFPGYSPIAMRMAVPGVFWRMASNGSCERGDGPFRLGILKDINSLTLGEYWIYLSLSVTFTNLCYDIFISRIHWSLSRPHAIGIDFSCQLSILFLLLLALDPNSRYAAIHNLFAIVYTTSYTAIVHMTFA